MSISVDTQAVPTAKLTWEQAVPKIQQKTIRSCFKGEEGRWFRERMEQLNEILSDVPNLMEQDGKGDEAIVYLHYFNAMGSGDWWITELNPQTREAFGYADLGYPELGYISIEELVQLPTIELDLHWKSKTLGEVKRKIRR